MLGRCPSTWPLRGRPRALILVAFSRLWSGFGSSLSERTERPHRGAWGPREGRPWVGVGCPRRGPCAASACLSRGLPRARVGRGRPLRLSRETRFCAHRCVSCYRLQSARARPLAVDMRQSMEAPLFRWVRLHMGDRRGEPHFSAWRFFNRSFLGGVARVSWPWARVRKQKNATDPKTEAPPVGP